MPSGRNLIVVLALGIGVALAAGGMVLATRARWQHAALDTPVLRGRLVAERMGCFGCHGPGGAQPIGNPGSKGGEVPGWTGGTWMMWNRDEHDVRAWIVNGRPDNRARDLDALIRMPAYGSRLTERETGDLVAYVLAVSQFGRIEDEAASAGHDAAYRLGCLGCHGSEGRGLVMNPGSFKGYIPPWDGPDYLDLVRNDAEFSQWVRAGACDRLMGNPVASRILRGQTIAMPAYGDRVTDNDLRALSAYVAWVRSHRRETR